MIDQNLVTLIIGILTLAGAMYGTRAQIRANNNQRDQEERRLRRETEEAAKRRLDDAERAFQDRLTAEVLRSQERSDRLQEQVDTLRRELMESLQRERAKDLRIQELERHLERVTSELQTLQRQQPKGGGTP